MHFYQPLLCQDSPPLLWSWECFLVQSYITDVCWPLWLKRVPFLRECHFFPRENSSVWTQYSSAEGCDIAASLSQYCMVPYMHRKEQNRGIICRNVTLLKLHYIIVNFCTKPVCETQIPAIMLAGLLERFNIITPCNVCRQCKYHINLGRQLFLFSLQNWDKDKQWLL